VHDSTPGLLLYLFICSLCNNALSNSDYTESNDLMVMNNELERVWEKVMTVSFKILFLHLRGETEEYHESLSQDSQCSNQDLNRAPPEYKSESLPPDPTCSLAVTAVEPLLKFCLI
jgi:hypothetical protein